MAIRGTVADAVAAVAVTAIMATPDQDVVAPVLEAALQALIADAAGFYEHQTNGLSLPLQLAPAFVWEYVPFRSVPTSKARALHPGIDHLVAHGAPATPTP
jgi:hypothetical protein